jgi:two-component system cell cycle response regulator
MRVLIAEDDNTSRLLLGSTLEKWKYEVEAVCDGAQAWKALQREDAPRLAILDWMMPGMTGPALCCELRKRRSEPYVYILLLTARSDKRDLIEGLASGADDYVTKPFDKQELEFRLRAGRRILELQDELVAAREALREQATRDPLTCLWNRYSILNILNRELKRSQRERIPLSVIMADLDHFKHINDTWGHLAGDAVLREAARRMQVSLRAYDSVGRYGGEEFLIVLPGLTCLEAESLAERLRVAIAGEPIPVAASSVAVTISLGVMDAPPGCVMAETLIHAADEALYRAKALGRNRLERAQLSAPFPETQMRALAACLSPSGNG